MAEQYSSQPPLSAGLYLVGIGPGCVDLMTIDALSIAQNADYRRYEAYTALWPDSELERLERRVGPIEKMMRPEVESPNELFTLAQQKSVALLVVGDPLQATTHVELQLQAAEAGVKCYVTPGISITNLVTGMIGLSNYKFGRQTTITYPYGNWIATSPLEVIAMNRVLGLHTLALLDLDPTGLGTGEQRPMKPINALDSLSLMQSTVQNRQSTSLHPALDETVFSMLVNEDVKEWPVILCSDLGTSTSSIIYTTCGNLSHLSGGAMNCLVFPANLSENESSAIQRWNGHE